MFLDELFVDKFLWEIYIHRHENMMDEIIIWKEQDQKSRFIHHFGSVYIYAFIQKSIDSFHANQQSFVNTAGCS